MPLWQALLVQRDWESARCWKLVGWLAASWKRACKSCLKMEARQAQLEEALCSGLDDAWGRSSGD